MHVVDRQRFSNVLFVDVAVVTVDLVNSRDFYLQKRFSWILKSWRSGDRDREGVDIEFNISSSLSRRRWFRTNDHNVNHEIAQTSPTC